MWTTNYTSILSAGLPMKKRSFSILSLFVTGIFSLSVKKPYKSSPKTLISLIPQHKPSSFMDSRISFQWWDWHHVCLMLRADPSRETGWKLPYHKSIITSRHQQSPIVPRRGSQHTLIWQHCIDYNWMYITLPFPDFVYTMFTQVPIKLLKDSHF